MHGIFTPLALSSYKINAIPAPHFPRKLTGGGDNLSSFSFTHCVAGSGCFNGNLSSLQFYCRSAGLGYLNAIYPHFRLLVMRRVWVLERLFILFPVCLPCGGFGHLNGCLSFFPFTRSSAGAGCLFTLTRSLSYYFKSQNK